MVLGVKVVLFVFHMVFLFLSVNDIAALARVTIEQNGGKDDWIDSTKAF